MIVKVIVNDNVSGAFIMAMPLWEFTRFIWWTRHSARWPPTFGQSQSPRVTNPPKLAAIVTTFTTTIRYYSAQKLVLILPSCRGQKAELTWVAGYVPKWFTSPLTSHPSKHLARFSVIIRECKKCEGRTEAYSRLYTGSKLLVPSDECRALAM